ncbi:MAG: ankyrin repeat protein [Gammaproteobacteria bacterium]|nr:MAG: ankyrin repeat protein [Gammaproteobacteria bacterium]UTW43857.1 ankyrin repeat domain-containing protein [bacterium SCSIO 12844]
MNKVNGWVANIHGIRNPITDHPFSPEGNNWNVNFLGPMGSVLEDGYFYAQDRLSNLKSYGKWSKDENGNVNQMLYQKDDEGKNNQIGVKHGDKYKQETKQVGGSLAHQDKLMNISIYPTTKKQGMNIDSIFSQITNSSMGAGFIYARHSRTDLKSMLSDVNHLDVSKNLTLSICRGGFLLPPFQTQWDSDNNKGPYIVDELQTLRLHDIAKQARQCHRPELIEKAQEIIRENPEEINKIDKDGRTALFYALSSENYELANLLIDHGVVYGDNNMLNLIIYNQPSDDLYMIMSDHYNIEINSGRLNNDLQQTMKFAIGLNKVNEIKSIMKLNIPFDLSKESFDELINEAGKNDRVINILNENKAKLCPSLELQNPIMPFSSFDSLNERGSVNDVEPLH